MDRLNKWLTLAANLGVVAGILLLAVEISQNQELLDRNFELTELQYELQVADGLQGIAESVNEWRFLRAGDAEVAQIWLDGIEGRELSAVNQVRFNDICSARIWTGATAYGRNIALGRLDLAEAEAWVRREENASRPAFQKCWEDNIAGLVQWGYEGLVDAVASAPPD